MRKLLIKVDCGKSVCGKCSYAREYPDEMRENYQWCNLFKDVLREWRRCLECLQAEKTNEEI